MTNWTVFGFELQFGTNAQDARSGLYYGPDKLGEVRGSPAVAKVPPQAQDTHAAARFGSSMV